MSREPVSVDQASAAIPAIGVPGSGLTGWALEAGQTVAYLFDFGDEWRVRLKLVEIRETGSASATAILESRGAAPPQYGWGESDLGDAA